MQPSIDPLTGSLIFKPIEYSPVNKLKSLVERLGNAPNLNPDFNP